MFEAPVRATMTRFRTALCSARWPVHNVLVEFRAMLLDEDTVRVGTIFPVEP
jgi:hypothetical protein